MSPATTALRPASPPPPEALVLLREDHRALREVFMRYRWLAGRGACSAEREPLAHRACTLVEMHASIGEDLVYPAAAPSGEADEMVRMSDVDCGTWRKIIHLVRDTDPGEPRFDALVLALGDCVERRLAHEEAELFGRVRRAPVDLGDLGRRIRLRHEAWMSLCC